MSAFISGIGTATPNNKISQNEVLSFMQNAHQLDDEAARKLAILYRATGIKNRYSVLSDYSDSGENSFFPNTPDLEPFPTTKQRNELFQKEAVDLSVKAVENCLVETQASKDEITHLITVSCTGLYAPGLDIDIVEKLGLNHSIERTGINFMGCYAAFNALKAANYICEAQEAKVLVICTELCSIHFQKESSEDNLLSNALFGDGSAAVLVQSKPSQTGKDFEISDFFCDLLPNGNKEMTWAVGDFGFDMKLSAYVPDVIKEGVSNLINKLMNRFNEEQFHYFAIHPGGKKILQVLETALGITKKENQPAYNVLSEYGNMSSPTILFVLKSIMENLTSEDHNKNILSFAFGPGLTLESMVFKIKHP